MQFNFSLCTDQYWQRKCNQLSTPQLMELEAKANRILTERELSVTFKTVPALSGNLHDYVSLSKYDWPNPNTANGLPWIKRDGMTNPDFDKYDIVPLFQLCNNVGTLTAATRLLKKTAYAEKAGKFLKCWFLDPATAMTPHLNYAQFLPGNQTGSSWGLIDSHCFCALLEAVSALPLNNEWTADDLQKLKYWFMEYFLWFISNPLPIQEERTPTNHGTWYDAQYISIAMLLNRPDLARRQIREKSIPRLDVQLLYNGLQPYEITRTLSLSYSVFNLEAWSRIAAYAKVLGIDLWNQRSCSVDKGCLREAFQCLIPFLTGQRKWDFLQIGPLPRPGRLFATVHDFLEPVENFSPGLELFCISPER